MKSPFIQLWFFLAAVAAPVALVCLYKNDLATHNTNAGNSQEPTGSGNGRRRISEQWDILDPILEHQTGDSSVLLRYGNMNDGSNGDDGETDSSTAASSSVSVWSRECRSGGGNELVAEGGSVLTVEKNPNGSVAAVGIALDRLWSEFAEQIDIDNADSDEISTTRSVGLCVRYALSSVGNETLDGGDSNETNALVENLLESGNETLSGDDSDGPKRLEVNVVETVVTATISLARQPDTGENADPAPFLEVMDATLSRPPEGLRWQPEAFHHNFTVQGFLCPGNGDNTPIVKLVSQGSVLTLCVQPLYPDAGFRISSIEEFTWTKTRIESSPSPPLAPPPNVTVGTSSQNNSSSNGNSNRAVDTPRVVTVEKLSSPVSRGIGNHSPETAGETVHATQAAVRGGAASDPFTVYGGCNDGETFCTLSTLLRPDFYRKPHGRMSGSGSVSLEFGATTRTAPIEWKSTETQ